MRALWWGGKWDRGSKGEGMGGSYTQRSYIAAWSLRTSTRARDSFLDSSFLARDVILDENICLLRK